MKLLPLLLLISVAVQLCVAPPVNQKKKDAKHENEVDVDDIDDGADILGYRRYLTEVVQVLESDPEFREKLEKADEADIRTGKIADQLQFVNHNIRSRLDEIKREELERLRHLATREHELQNDLDVDHLKIPEHLDHTNTRSFEIQDLKRLIAKTTKDLAKADQKRREQFKQYEMEQKYEEQEKLRSMNEIERQNYEKELHSMKEKQKKHDPVHHPGSKQQLEEVWEKQDHMESDDFNPKTFFYFHDIDGNGVWDQDEVKALFLKELDKLYSQGASQADLLRRAEEMERMREHVFNEADLNKDGLINFEEFLEQTRKPEFQRDEGWQGLDEQQIYTQEEFEAFEKYKHEEMQKMIAKGMLPPHPGNIPAQVEPFPPQYGHASVAPGAVPHQANQIPPQYLQQPPAMVQQNVQQSNLHGQVPNVQQQVPNVQQQVPNVPQQVPNVPQQVPNVQQQVPNVQPLVQNMQQQVPNMQPQVPNMQQQVPNVQSQVPNVQPQVQNVQPQVQNMQPQVQNVQPQFNLNEMPRNVQNNAMPQQNTQKQGA